MVQEAVGATTQAMRDTRHYDLIVIGGSGPAEFAAFAMKCILAIIPYTKWCKKQLVAQGTEDMTDTRHYDLIVIGGGPAGQGAAEFAAFAGRRTLVIERKTLGGLVVTTGGGPTKTLREAALHLTGFRHRALYGLTEQPDIGMAVERTRARTRKVSSAMQDFTRSVFVDRLGVDVVYGSASLGPNRTVIVTPSEGSETKRVFTAQKILIATGSRPFHPANIPFEDPDIFDSEVLPNLKRVPKSVLVVGGGSIGCEYASIFTAFGIPVTVVHSGARLLGTMDSELSRLLCRVFENQGMRIVLGTGVRAAGRVDGKLQVTLETDEVSAAGHRCCLRRVARLTLKA